MLNQDLVRKMFSLSQQGHPEKIWVLEQLPLNEVVIYDMGCGLNKTIESAIGVDINPVTNLTASLDCLPSIPGKTVDVIISRHSLEHMIDPIRTLQEWRRILKPEGKMIFVLPDHEKIDTLDPVLSGGRHLHAFTMDSFRNLITSLWTFSGKIEKIEPVVEGWSFGAVISFHQENIVLSSLNSFLDQETSKSEIVQTEEYFPELNQITGMMSNEELKWLYKTARKMDSVVEIGSWMGRSTHALLSGCKGKVLAVDTFKGSADPIETGHRDVYLYFFQNVGMFENLLIDPEPSLEAVKAIDDKTFDLVFIDGGHQRHEVIADIKAWLPKARKMIAVHDYHDKVVKQVVDEMLGEGKVCGTIYFKELE